MAILQEATSSSARLDGGSGVGWQYRLGRLVLLPLGFALAVLLAWELLCRTSRVSPVLPPPPSAVWSVLSGNWEILLQQSVPTTLEAIASFAAATLLGVALAVAITFSAWVREALYPNIVTFQLIPKIALAPLFIVWLGVGSRSWIVVAIFIAFFPIVVSTATGLVSAKPEVLQLCRSLTASEWQIFRLAGFSLCDAVRLCRDEGRSDDGDDRRHRWRVHHRSRRARLHHHVCLLGRRDGDGAGRDCPALRNRLGTLRPCRTGRNGDAALVWRRDAGRRRDITALA